MIVKVLSFDKLCTQCFRCVYTSKLHFHFTYVLGANIYNFEIYVLVYDNI